MNEPAQSTPSLRESAVAFIDGTKAGWITADLVAWTHDHLIAPGRFHSIDGTVRRVQEHGLGEIVLASSPVSPRTANRTQTSSLVPVFVATARERVIHVLRETLRTDDSGFVNVALYAGRVSRDRGPDGKSVWRAYVSENDALSDQVLALFAADALTFPADYEKGIAVCDACGSVSFGFTPSRHGCVSHPYGATEGKPGDRSQQKEFPRS